MNKYGVKKAKLRRDKFKINRKSIIYLILMLIMGVGFATLTDNITVSGTVTVHGGKYDVTFDPQGGTMGTISTTASIILNGTKGNLPSPTKELNVFNGWYSGPNGAGTKYLTYENINKTMTLYASWTPCTSCSAGTGANCSVSVSNNTCVYSTSCKSGYEKISNNGKYNPSCTGKSFTCSAGQYLSGSGASCTACTAGNYCPGGTFTYNGSNQGINKCPSGYTSDASAASENSCYISLKAGQKKTKTGTAESCPSNTYYGSARKAYYNTEYTCTACAAGYSSSAGASSCSANTYYVYWNTNGGTIDGNAYASNSLGTSITYNTSTMYQGTTGYTRIPNWAKASRTAKANSVFNGWYTSASGGTKVFDGAGNYQVGSYWNSSGNWSYAGNLPLYAQFSTCKACAAGTGANCSLSVSNNTCTYATSCKTGYSNISNNGKYNPSCTINSYTQTLNWYKYNASGSVSNPSHAFEYLGSKNYSAQYNSTFSSKDHAGDWGNVAGFHYWSRNSDGWTVTGNKNDSDCNHHYYPNKYALTVDANKGSGGTGTTHMEYGTYVDLTAPTRSGWSFNGWTLSYNNSTGSSLSGSRFTMGYNKTYPYADYTSAATATVTANWKDTSAPYCKIWYQEVNGDAGGFTYNNPKQVTDEYTDVYVWAYDGESGINTDRVEIINAYDTNYGTSISNMVEKVYKAEKSGEQYDGDTGRTESVYYYRVPLESGRVNHIWARVYDKAGNYSPGSGSLWMKWN